MTNRGKDILEEEFTKRNPLLSKLLDLKYRISQERQLIKNLNGMTNEIVIQKLIRNGLRN